MGTISLVKKAVYVIIAVVLFAAGGGTMYYVKYRPLRKESNKLEATNKLQKKQLAEKDTIISVVWRNYVELAKMPKYQIDQHLGKVKMRHGSRFNFAPNALMSVVDSVAPLMQGDSITLELKAEKPNFWRRLFGKK